MGYNKNRHWKSSRFANKQPSVIRLRVLIAYVYIYIYGITTRPVEILRSHILYIYIDAHRYLLVRCKYIFYTCRVDPLDRNELYIEPARRRNADELCRIDRRDFSHRRLTTCT